MQTSSNEFLYVNKNLLLPPKYEAKALLQVIIMKLKHSSEKNLRIRYYGYSVRDSFFVMMLKELEFSIEDRRVQKELAHCDKIEICGDNPEEGSVVIWGGNETTD